MLPPWTSPCDTRHPQTRKHTSFQTHRLQMVAWSKVRLGWQTPGCRAETQSASPPELCQLRTNRCISSPVHLSFCPSRPRWGVPSALLCTCRRCSWPDWQLSGPGGPHRSQHWGNSTWITVKLTRIQAGMQDIKNSWYSEILKTRAQFPDILEASCELSGAGVGFYTNGYHQ